MSHTERRKSDVDKAHEIQIIAGTQSALRATAIGFGLAVLGHYFWPAFRRQSHAFKAFLISGFTLVGLTFGAEKALLRYEAERRVEENIWRRRAHLELAQQGVIPTETEIAKWRSRNES